MNETTNWFVVQTLGGKEFKTRDLVEKQKFKGIKTLLPKRRLLIRRKGEYKWELKPLFPGYFFINGNITPDIYKRIINLTGVVKILKDANTNKPKEVSKKDMKLIFSLMTDKENEVIPESKAIEINDKVQIVEGPLKGIEGRIVDVERRKKRVKVKLPFFNTYKIVYLSYELIEKIEEKEVKNGF